MCVSPKTPRYVAGVPEVHRKTPEDDDEIDPLPPIDGEGEEERDEDEDELDEEPKDDASPLDDSTGEDDPIEDEDFGEDEASAIGDDDDGPADATEEVATFHGGDAAPFAEGDDAPGIGDDLDIDEDLTDASTKDGGEEGLDEEDEELRAEDLPPLDADDEAEHADEGFFDRLADAGDGLAWDPHPWELVLAHAMDGVSALAAGEGGAYVFAQKLFWLNDRGVPRALSARGLNAPVVELVASPGVLDAVLDGGRVVRSTDDGESFAALDDMRSKSRAPAPGAPSARFEPETGRAIVVVGDRIVADVSNDADIDGEEARIQVIDRRGELVWVATRAAVLAYRAT